MNKLINFIVAVSLVAGLTSCLKDDAHYVDFKGAGYVAEIPYVANRSILKAVSVPVSSSATVAPVDINIASPNPPTESIQVGVAVDAAALSTYNATSTTKYTLLPSSAYQLNPSSVTIAAGSRIGTLNVSLLGNQVPTTGGPYALALTIQSVPGNVTISANYKTQILAVTLTK